MNPATESLLRGIIESMDHTTPATSQSGRPSQRLRARAKERRIVRVIVCCLASIAIAVTAITTLAAITAR